MGVEHEGFRIGAFTSPLTASTANSLLQDADPALHVMLAYYQAMLQTHLGARFDAEVVAAGRSDLVGKISSLVIPYDPIPYLKASQQEPPFLALYATSEKPIEKTRNWVHSEAQWTLQWVLPPLDPAQYLKLYPFLRAVFKVILDRTEQGYDPTYQSGALQLAAAGLEELKIDEVFYGSIESGGRARQASGREIAETNLFFPALEISMTATERKNDSPGILPFEGLDGSIDVADQDGSETIIEFQQELQP